MIDTFLQITVHAQFNYLLFFGGGGIKIFNPLSITRNVNFKLLRRCDWSKTCNCQLHKKTKKTKKTKKKKNLFNRFLLETFFFATEFFILLHLSDNHICPPFDNRFASQLRISSAILVLSSSLYNLLSAFTYEEREKPNCKKRMA